MGEALDIAAVTGAWQTMLLAPDRPDLEAWRAEQEPSLRRLSSEAWRIEVNADDRRGLLRAEAALRVDRLLARVARGRGALDVAVGEALGALAVGDRSLRLGYCSVGDYARENLGIAARTAQAMAQLSRELRERPLLRDAVLRGEVSAGKARRLLRVAVGPAEAAWVERARAETVRRLEAAVRAEGEEGEPEEAWEHIGFPLGPEARAELDEVLELAGRVAGGPSRRHQRLEAMAQEYLGGHPDAGEVGGEAGGGGCEGSRCRGESGAPSAAARPAWAGATWMSVAAANGAAGPSRAVDEASGDGAPCRASGFHPPPDSGFPSWAVEDWLEAAKAGLELETADWEALAVLDPVAAPRAGQEASPQALDQELRRLVAMRRRWDELLGHLGLLMTFFRLCRELGFVSFDHYCEERLWMSPRAVEQRVWLERRFYDLPGLREVMRAGRLSYEQARLVAGVAEPETLEGWLRRAEGMTCIDLERAVADDEERQICTRRELSLRVPVRVAEILSAAFGAAGRKAGRWLSPEECLLEIARHFGSVWREAVAERSTPKRRARRRDKYCQVPGCSRMACQTHHIIPVSQGGTDDAWNLVGLCAAHHLHGVHRGYVRVRGRAPDQLVWELGEHVGPRC